MTLTSFIEQNEVEYSENRIANGDIVVLENAVGVKFGKELREYLLKYGYLAYEFSELYGVTESQMLNSDIVKETRYLHEYYPITNALIAIEDQGEGDYFVVDSKDQMYEFDSEIETLTRLNLSLFEYITSRFMRVKELIEKQS